LLSRPFAHTLFKLNLFDQGKYVKYCFAGQSFSGSNTHSKIYLTSQAVFEIATLAGSPNYTFAVEDSCGSDWIQMVYIDWSQLYQLIKTINYIK
jgi:hypothetical protein